MGTKPIMRLQICSRCGKERRFKFDMCAPCRARQEEQNDLSHDEIEAILNNADERQWNLKPHWNRQGDAKK